MDATQQQALAGQLAKLRADYMARLPAELAALQALAGALQGGEGDRASLEALHQRLHKLAGSGGTFGLAALGAAARALEQRVVTWLAGALDAVDASAWRALAAELGALAQSAGPGEGAERGQETGERAAPSALIPAPSPLRSAEITNRIWVMEDDAALGQQLVVRALAAVQGVEGGLAPVVLRTLLPAIAVAQQCVTRPRREAAGASGHGARVCQGEGRES